MRTYRLKEKTMKIWKVIIKFLQTYEFWATLIGVFIAFMLSSLYDRHIKYEEEVKNRIKTMETIKAELQENLRHIGGVGDKSAALIVRFSTVAMDSAVSSGRFALLDVEMQNELAIIYRNFKYAEMFSNKVFSMLGSVDMAMGNANQSLQEFNRRLNRIEESLKGQIPRIVKLLDEKIKDTEQ